MNDTPEDAALAEMERDLTALAARPSHIDRDRLMFLAGREAARSAASLSDWRGWLWPSATVAASFVAVVLGILFAARPTRVVREIVYVAPAEQPSTAVVPTANTDVDDGGGLTGHFSWRAATDWPSLVGNTAERNGIGKPNYLHTRQLVLALGVDALPSRSTGAGSAPLPLRASDVLSELSLKLSRIR